jgi:hypothetical protein
MLQAQPRQHPKELQKKGPKSYTPEPVSSIEVAHDESNVEAESNSVNAERFPRLSIIEEDEEMPTHVENQGPCTMWPTLSGDVIS